VLGIKLDVAENEPPYLCHPITYGVKLLFQVVEHNVHETVENEKKEVCLAGKVMIYACFAQLGGCRDVFHAGLGKAFLAEEIRARLRYSDSLFAQALVALFRTSPFFWV
jgi:cobalamin biosynthesis protein CobD/CbiB